MASLTQPHGTCGFCVYSVQVIKTMALGATLVKKITLSLLSQHLQITFAQREASAVGCVENSLQHYVYDALELSSQSTLILPSWQAPSTEATPVQPSVYQLIIK